MVKFIVNIRDLNGLFLQSRRLSEGMSFEADSVVADE